MDECIAKTDFNAGRYLKHIAIGVFRTKKKRRKKLTRETSHE